MSLSRTAKSNVLPAPLGGVNFREPLAAMSPTDATWLLNVDCETQFIKQRPGTKIDSSIPTAPSSKLILAMGTWGYGTSQKLFAFCYTQGGPFNFVYDVSTPGAPVLVFTGIDNSATQAAWINYKGYGTFVVNNSTTSNFPTVNPTGTVADGWYQTSGGVKGRTGAFVYYKSRPYYRPYDLTSVYYGITGQVAGVLPYTFNVQDVFTYDVDTVLIATFSISDGATNQNYICFGNRQGEVLVYSGDYPGSSNWAIAGRLKIPRPVGFLYAKTIVFENDTLVITRTGLVSLRQLFQQGNVAGYEQSVSNKITDYWTKLFKNVPESTILSNADVSGVWSESKQKIYILVQGHIDYSGNYVNSLATILVYNTTSGAWSFYTIYNDSSVPENRPGNLTIFRDDLYYSNNYRVMKFDDSVFTDTDPNSANNSSIPLRIYSSFQPYENQTTVSKLSGFQPVISQNKHNLAFSTVADFGVKSSLATSPVVQDGFNKPFCSVGVEGTFLQYKIEGETLNGSIVAGDSLEFYSMNVVYEKGGNL